VAKNETFKTTRGRRSETIESSIKKKVESFEELKLNVAQCVHSQRESLKKEPHVKLLSKYWTTVCVKGVWQQDIARVWSPTVHFPHGLFYSLAYLDLSNRHLLVMCISFCRPIHGQQNNITFKKRLLDKSISHYAKNTNLWGTNNNECSTCTRHK